MKEILSKILWIVKHYQREAIIGIYIVLIGIISFNLGKINSFQKTPLQVGDKAIIYDAVNDSDKQQETSKQVKKLDLRVVVSKNSDKYHFSWCSSAKRIKEENKIWFNSEQEAIGAGYILAGNCSK